MSLMGSLTNDNKISYTPHSRLFYCRGKDGEPNLEMKKMFEVIVASRLPDAHFFHLMNQFSPRQSSRPPGVTRIEQNIPVCEALGMTPMNGANDLRYPPFKIRLGNATIVRTRLEDIPERAALSIIHDEIQMSRSLEGAEEMWSPWRVGFDSL